MSNRWWMIVAAVVGGMILSAEMPQVADPCVDRNAKKDDRIGDGPIVIPLAQYAGVLRSIPVRIGDRDVPFLFDTGGGGTILSPKSAESLGCRPFGRGTGFRHDGGRVDARRAGPVELSIGDYRRIGEVGVLDLDQLLAGLPPVGGIISLETFAGRAITVDLSNGKLIVEDAASLVERRKSSQEIKIRIARQSAGAGLDVFVAVDGRKEMIYDVSSGTASMAFPIKRRSPAGTT